MTHVAAVLSALALLGWIYLAFFHGRFWQLLFDDRDDDIAAWPSIDVVVPARNEAEVLPKTLPSLLAQDYGESSWPMTTVTTAPPKSSVGTTA